MIARFPACFDKRSFFSLIEPFNALCKESAFCTCASKVDVDTHEDSIKKKHRKAT
jgi:hypothetical protein